MAEPDPPAPHGPSGRAARRDVPWAVAFSVHVFTAAGAGLGFLALIAATQGAWGWMFAWLGAGLVVDGVDGAIARRLGVAERLPRWSGATLDLVVDFTTYVFVPAYAIAASGLLPMWTGIGAGVAIVVSGALYFADGNMKTSDNYFLGFPAVWNLVAFYLLLLQPHAWVSLLAIAALAVMTFVPAPFVHPLRVRQGRSLSIALLGAWTALALLALVADLRPDAWVTAGLCAIGLYFLLVGIVGRRRR